MNIIVIITNIIIKLEEIQKNTVLWGIAVKTSTYHVLQDRKFTQESIESSSNTNYCFDMIEIEEGMH